MGPNKELGKTEFVDWCSKNLPHLFNGVHSFLMMKLSGAKFEGNDWHKRMSQVATLQYSSHNTGTYATVMPVYCSPASLLQYKQSSCRNIVIHILSSSLTTYYR